MSVRTADPLPECALCDTPVLRAAWEANGGLCTGCTRGIADTVRMLPASKVVDIERLREMRQHGRRPSTFGDETVFVEAYVPPLPGTDQ
jgi:hypothetical protein